MLGLCSLAQNSLRALRALRSNSCAKSEVEGRSRARLQSPALLADAYGRRLGSLRIAPRRAVVVRIKPMRSEVWLVLLFGPRGRRRGAQDFGAARSAFVD